MSSPSQYLKPKRLHRYSRKIYLFLLFSYHQQVAHPSLESDEYVEIRASRVPSSYNLRPIVQLPDESAMEKKYKISLLTIMNR